MPRSRNLPPRTPELGALGEAIRLIREEKGMSQEEVAKGARSDLTQVGGIERGGRNPTYVTMLRLADALGSSVGEITTLADRLHRARRTKRRR